MLSLRAACFGKSAVLVAMLWPIAASCATVSVSLHDGLADPPIIAVNVGDTVTWTLLSGSTGSVEAVSGEWKSPALTNGGSSFALTFANAGVIAYRTALVFGAVEVISGATNAPPITLNCPVDGSYFPSGDPVEGWNSFMPLQASLNITNGVRRVDFLLGDQPLGSVTNAPYQMVLADPMPGYAVLSARVTTREGIAFSSRSVRVGVGATIVYRPRRLPGGGFLCYWSLADPAYSPPPPSSPMGIIALSTPRRRDYVGFSDLPPVFYGVFYDGTATNVAQRFYFLGLRP